jgi:hypothetical protein
MAVSGILSPKTFLKERPVGSFFVSVLWRVEPALIAGTCGGWYSQLQKNNKNGHGHGPTAHNEQQQQNLGHGHIVTVRAYETPQRRLDQQSETRARAGVPCFLLAGFGFGFGFVCIFICILILRH